MDDTDYSLVTTGVTVISASSLVTRNQEFARIFDMLPSNIVLEFSWQKLCSTKFLVVKDIFFSQNICVPVR